MLKAKMLLAMVACALMLVLNSASAIEGPRGLFIVTSSTAEPTNVNAGQMVRLTAIVVATQNENNFTVGFHIQQPNGAIVAGNFFTGLNFVAGVPRTIMWDWMVPANIIGSTLYSAAAVYSANWLWYAALDSNTFTVGGAPPSPPGAVNGGCGNVVTRDCPLLPPSGLR